MSQIKRQHEREAANFEVAVYWEYGDGKVGSCRPIARDTSESGMCLQSPVRIEPGMHVYLDVAQYGFPLEGVIRYCTPDEAEFRIGLEFSSTTKQSMQPPSIDIDYYEVLQLSPKAELETIRRVYRIMAARFHPDNPESGDQEKFMLISEAYKILSDPERRNSYDTLRGVDRQKPLPLFQAKVFVDEKEGEANRRLGVMCLLYAQRRRDTEHPSVNLLELEQTMSIPREYLEFTMWYLKQKRFVENSDSADYVLTCDGVDFVEEHSHSNALVVNLLQMPGANDPAGPVVPEAYTGTRVQ